jgi:DNA helicase II / ATP-dependent DNA helicase PcrA
MNEFLTSLNVEQKEAVLHNEGPLLILAGAGTGKTRVLTSRIANLIYNGFASPFQILAVTFTNKAANEMKERIGNLIYGDVSNLWIGTFHSIAAKILRRHCEILGLKPDFTIIDPDDQTRLIKKIMEDFRIDIKEFLPKNYTHKINEWKDKGYTPEYIKNSYFDKKYYPDLRDVYSQYQTRLKQLNVCDFGDLLLYNVELFQAFPEILAIYLDKFKYTLVDEYQDTNAIQHIWLQLISGLNKKKVVNICCVGDDDQSIYGWRGAKIENILKFENDYKKTKIIRLERNYRSTSNILEIASSLITNNNNRHEKTLWTKSENQGEKVTVFCFVDDRDEARSTANEIQGLIKQKLDYKDIAILVRAGYQTRLFEESFMSLAIPYKIVGGLKFYERREIKDCIAYLRLIKNPADGLAFERIVNLPKRGIGSVTLSKIFEQSKKGGLNFLESAKTLCDFGEIKGGTKEILMNFVDSLYKWHNLIDNISHTELASKALEEFGYLEYVKNEKDENAKARLENIEEFIRGLEEFENLGDFLEYVSLVNDPKNQNDLPNSVNVMTIHAAKGLEFDTVFLPGWEEGVFPSPKSTAESDRLEEERRLAYVAITRAKRKLYISYARRRYTFGEVQVTTASRFLQELPKKNILEVNKGVLTSDDEVLDYVNSLENDEIFLTKKHFYSKDIEYKRKNYYRKAKKISLQDNVFLNKKTMAKMVSHKIFGDGVILSEFSGKCKVAFKNGGIKTILKSFLEIKKSN